MADEYGDKFVTSPLLLCALIGAFGFSLVEILHYCWISDEMADVLIIFVAWLMFGVPVFVVVFDHLLTLIIFIYEILYYFCYFIRYY